jgi:ATP sulfurylase
MKIRKIQKQYDSLLNIHNAEKKYLFGLITKMTWDKKKYSMDKTIEFSKSLKTEEGKSPDISKVYHIIHSCLK